MIPRRVWVQLTPADYRKAAGDEAKILSHDWIKPGNNYTGLEAEHRFFAGNLGEIALGRWLAAEGIQHEEFHRVDGRADDGDFRVWYFTRPRILDIKSTPVVNAQYLMMPTAQLRKKTNVDIYIGGMVVHEKIGVWLEGWTSRQHMEIVPPVVRFPYNVETSMVLFDHLRPMSRLWEKLDKGE